MYKIHNNFYIWHAHYKSGGIFYKTAAATGVYLIKIIYYLYYYYFFRPAEECLKYLLLEQSCYRPDMIII